WGGSGGEAATACWSSMPSGPSLYLNRSWAPKREGTRRDKASRRRLSILAYIEERSDFYATVSRQGVRNDPLTDALLISSHPRLAFANVATVLYSVVPKCFSHTCAIRRITVVLTALGSLG